MGNDITQKKGGAVVYGIMRFQAIIFGKIFWKILKEKYGEHFKSDIKN